MLQETKFGLTEKDRGPLILIYDRLELHSKDIESLNLMPSEVIFNEKILMWALKEIYLSPYKVFINKLDRNKLIYRFLKAKKYIELKQEYKLEELISYFITCLYKELEQYK